MERSTLSAMYTKSRISKIIITRYNSSLDQLKHNTTTNHAHTSQLYYGGGGGARIQITPKMC